MKTVKNIQPQLQEIIDSTIQCLLIEFSKIEDYKDIDITEIRGYIVDGNRGYAHLKQGYFTVPFWAYKKGINDYFIYYTAHELSHIITWRKYCDEKGHHDFKFYDIFMKICPKEFQKYELNYKKSSIKYGIEIN